MKLMIYAFISAAAIVSAANTPAPTFYKDVLPVLENRCQECHRPGEIAPMSLLTYDQARPWAKSIKAAILAKKMPPWFADPHYGKFSNDRALSQTEIETLVAWADTGAKAGNASDAPKPRDFYEGWQIGKPDLILSMPQAIAVPATGVIEYTYVVIPTGFTKDMWIQAAEVRPGAHGEMHHVIAFIRPPGSGYMKDAVPGVPFIPQHGARGQRVADSVPTELLIGWAPGLPPTICEPGQAKLVPAGSDIVLQLHYTPKGEATSDVTRVGFIFAKEPPKERVMTMNALDIGLRIPAGDPNYEAHSQITLQQDVKLVSMMPHMHLRGKDFEYQAVYPTGEKQILLDVPRWDFNWQLSYVLSKQLLLPKGTRIECTAHYDNSVNNSINPDATKEVHWGDQTFEEMMIGWFDVAFDPKADPRASRGGRGAR